MPGAERSLVCLASLTLGGLLVLGGPASARRQQAGRPAPALEGPVRQVTPTGGDFGVGLSSDGQFVAYISSDDQLNEGPPYGDGTPENPGFLVTEGNVFRANLDTGVTTHVPIRLPGDGTDPTSVGLADPLQPPKLSGDGRFVAFVRPLPFPPGSRPTRSGIFVSDMDTKSVALVYSYPWPPPTGAPTPSTVVELDLMAISADGKYILFRQDLAGQSVRLYGIERQGGEPRLVTDRATFTVDTAEDDANTISYDGRYVVFETAKPSGQRLAVVKDLTTGTEKPVSLPGYYYGGPLGGNRLSISGDGRFVALVGANPSLNLSAQTPIALVADTRKDTVRIASGVRALSLPVISSNGRFAAFLLGRDSGLLEKTDFQEGLFLKDLETGAIKLAEGFSKDPSLGPPGSEAPLDFVLADDGRIAFLQRRLFMDSVRTGVSVAQTQQCEAGARQLQLPHHTTQGCLVVDWQMPSRLTPELERKWGKEEPYGLPPASFVNPQDWPVILFLRSRSGEDPCGSGFSYRWQVSGEDKPLPDTGCEVKTTVPKLGIYDVTATQYKLGVPTGTVAENSQVKVRDWLIVGLGDSNGSGEGNPVPGQPHWVFPQCDRSLASYQYQTAHFIGQSSHSSVTFLFASCSGARTDHLWQHSYDGIQKGPPLPPQITQVKNVLGERKVDAVIMSVGINDLYFGPIITFCVEEERALNLAVLPRACEKLRVKAKYNSQWELERGFVSSYTTDSSSTQTLSDVTRRQLDLLPTLYAFLAAHLAGLHPAHVFITQYPDNAHDQNGKICTASSGKNFPHFFTSTWEWLSDTGRSLNFHVDATSNFRVNATSKLGWTPITGIPEDFLTHGYCATKTPGRPSSGSYFVPIVEAVFERHNLAGSFHPTAAGQMITYNHTRKAVCNALYGNPNCSDVP